MLLVQVRCCNMIQVNCKGILMLPVQVRCYDVKVLSVLVA